MDIHPIEAGTVRILLDYICPLSAPVPPHLLSRPLLQRLHFLGITPHNPSEYLCWPSPNQSHTVHLLQSEPVQPHDPFATQYTADSENILAHVRITPDIRLIFLWDNHNGWQYHNVALMPFPSGSFPDLTTALSPKDFLQEPAYSITVTQSDDDDYWGGYGQDDILHQPSISGRLDPDPSSEDAYWAQYSAVQGSGDSTLPSPRPEKQSQESRLAVEASAPQRIIVPSDDFQLHHTELYNPLEPPSPESLARRLAALRDSPRTLSPPLIDNCHTNSSSPRIAEKGVSSNVSQHQADEFVVANTANVDHPDPTHGVLKENIQSLYRLWSMGRQSFPHDDPKAYFLTAVQQALEQL